METSVQLFFKLFMHNIFFCWEVRVGLVVRNGKQKSGACTNIKIRNQRHQKPCLDTSVINFMKKKKSAKTGYIRWAVRSAGRAPKHVKS